MLDYARLTPGRGFQPLRAALYYSQRLVTIGAIRNAVSKAIATGIEHRHPLGHDPFATLVAQPFAALREDGCVSLGRLLNDTQLAEIDDFLDGKETLTLDGRRCVPDQHAKDVAIATYPLETTLACPHLLEMANHPAIVALASAYLGCKPTISSIGLRWFFPSDRSRVSIQRFHRDPDDWRFLKLFIYLTDMTLNTGPHLYVRTSHHGRGDLFARTYTLREIDKRFGTTRIQAFTGKAGTAFIADTRGIHCGGVPLTAARLMFQVQYSLLPIYALRYRPRSLDRPIKVDGYLNRLIVSDRNSN